MTTSNPPSRPATFGFTDGKFYTRRILHVALLQALGFKAERQERDTSGDFWYCVYPDGGVAQMSLPQAVSGIHDPRCLDASDAEKVRFYKAAQDYYQTLVGEVKRGD
jgi:hypothetical protein